MADKKTSVFGIYSNVTQAERAVDALVNGGFTNADVSVLLSDNRGSKDFAHEKNTKAPEGTTTGVTAGGAIGGTLGLLAGIGALAIPGVGPLIAAGPIMGALAGLGVGGAVGGIVGNQISATAVAYSPISNTWSPIAPMATVRRSPGVVYGPDNLIYAIGGSVGGGDRQ